MSKKKYDYFRETKNRLFNISITFTAASASGGLIVNFNRWISIHIISSISGITYFNLNDSFVNEVESIQNIGTGLLSSYTAARIPINNNQALVFYRPLITRSIKFTSGGTGCQVGLYYR